jgi:hypothetical protein
MNPVLAVTHELDSVQAGMTPSAGTVIAVEGDNPIFTLTGIIPATQNVLARPGLPVAPWRGTANRQRPPGHVGSGSDRSAVGAATNRCVSPA